MLTIPSLPAILTTKTIETIEMIEKLASPVMPSSDAKLEIKTTPGASCAITVHYKSGKLARGPTMSRALSILEQTDRRWVSRSDLAPLEAPGRPAVPPGAFASAGVAVRAIIISDMRDTVSRWLGRILVVDDDPDLVTMLTESFSDVGYTVDVAAHGGDALIAVSQYRPDVVLLDILMEGLDGVQVLERIRALDPAIRVIMITGSTDATLEPTAMAMGAFAYLTKPMALGQLHQAVEAALGAPRIDGLRGSGDGM